MSYLNWLEKTIGEIHAGIPDSAWEEVGYRQWLAEMYRAMDFLMRSGAWDVVNAYVAWTPGAPHQMSIAVLRFVSPVRTKIAEWPKLLERTKTELDRRNLDSTKLLRGLL